MGESKNEEVETTFFGMDKKILKGIGFALLLTVATVIILNIDIDFKKTNS